jgi:hypothetical protein
MFTEYPAAGSPPTPPDPEGEELSNEYPGEEFEEDPFAEEDGEEE